MKIATMKIILTFLLTGFFLGCQSLARNFNTAGTGSDIVEKSGELTQDEVWDGRVYVTGTVIVPEGITLTIRSGAIVGFEPMDTSSLLIVHGELYAEGVPDRMIVFGSLGEQQTVAKTEPEQKFETETTPGTIGITATPPKAGDWAGIQIEAESPNCRLTYCRIQYATIGIACRTDAVQIERCLFSENKIGVLCENTNPTVTGNEFNRNGTGVQFRGAASPEVEYNAFTANEYGLICEDDSRPRIHYNAIRANYPHAIVCYSTASPEIVSNNITMNAGWAVYDGGRLRDNFISGNKQVGPNVVERGIGTQSDQFYSVDEVFDPRTSPVPDAGVPRENF